MFKAKAAQTKISAAQRFDTNLYIEGRLASENFLIIVFKMLAAKFDANFISFEAGLGAGFTQVTYVLILLSL